MIIFRTYPNWRWSSVNLCGHLWHFNVLGLSMFINLKPSCRCSVDCPIDKTWGRYQIDLNNDYGQVYDKKNKRRIKRWWGKSET